MSGHTLSFFTFSGGLVQGFVMRTRGHAFQLKQESGYSVSNCTGEHKAVGGRARRRLEGIKDQREFQGWFKYGPALPRHVPIAADWMLVLQEAARAWQEPRHTPRRDL